MTTWNLPITLTIKTTGYFRNSSSSESEVKHKLIKQGFEQAYNSVPTIKTGYGYEKIVFPDVRQLEIVGKKGMFFSGNGMVTKFLLKQ